MTQLSIFESMGAAVEAIVTPERPSVDETPRVAGHDTIDDLTAILSTVPDVSPARGTSRQNRRLPVAYLYACPLLIEDKTEALRVIQRHCVVAREPITDAPMFHEVGEWLRINGESYVGAGEARAVTKRPSTREPEGFHPYRLDPRWGNVPGSLSTAPTRRARARAPVDLRQREDDPEDSMTYRPKLPTCPKCGGERGGHYYGCTNLPPRKDRTKPEPKPEGPCNSN